jgi:hypothetical protein
MGKTEFPQYLHWSRSDHGEQPVRRERAPSRTRRQTVAPSLDTENDAYLMAGDRARAYCTILPWIVLPVEKSSHPQHAMSFRYVGCEHHDR